MIVVPPTSTWIKIHLSQLRRRFPLNDTVAVNGVLYSLATGNRV